MPSVAFLVPSVFARSPFSSAFPRTHHQPLKFKYLPRACTAPQNPKPVEIESAPQDAPRFPAITIPPAATAGAQALLDDLAERPQYYLNVSGVLLGIILSVIVLSATLVALDRLPLIPDALRVIGMAYLFWFLGKFLLNAGERRRLQEEVDEFVQVIRGDSVNVMEEGKERRKLEADSDLRV